MRKIIITGGFGFVGGRLTKKLANNFSVIASSRNNVPTDILHAHGDILQIQHDQLLAKQSFPKDIDTVIHLAALNEWDCVQYPSAAIRVNIDETRMILENSISTGVRQFIYFSTAHIYGSPLQNEINELTLPVPVHPYAITHKAAEDYIVAASLQKKIKGIVIRLSNSFGAPVIPSVNRWTLLANDLCRQAIEKNKLTLLSNGCQYRDFICLSDVEQAIEYILQAAPSSFNKTIYNMGAGSSMRVIDMASAIATVYKNIFGKTIPIELPAGSVPSDEPSLQYQIQRLLSEGCAIRNDFNKELEELLLFCSKNFTVSK